MEILTPRLILREFRAGDFVALRQIEVRPETHRFEKVAIPAEEATRAYLAGAAAEAAQVPRQGYHLAVTIRPDDVPRGKIKLIVQRPEALEWEIGWVIHPDDWGQGYAPEAARAMLGLAFEQLKVHRVVAYCNALNVQSFRVMEKIGMRRDGWLRESLWWNGGWVDEFVYAILEREWA
jgi:RimJ/RimL family protein N-acetyltransferase